MALTPGARLGPHEIISLLGEGGMGEVYRARDTRLGRDVAIKTSRAQFNERFMIEARAIAALNHPNICTLYGVGPDYLVMEQARSARRTIHQATNGDKPTSQQTGVKPTRSAAMPIRGEMPVCRTP
jgi:hypothetical protein